MGRKLLGKRVKVVKGKDYFGMSGTIFYCATCCKAHRIQFDGIGNNVLFSKYKNKIQFLSPPTEERGDVGGELEGELGDF